MPHYMDIHTIEGATFEDVVGAHNLDMKFAHQHDVTPTGGGPELLSRNSRGSQRLPSRRG